MTRPRRDLISSKRFHFINHGVDGQDLFSIDDDRFVFESILSDVCETYEFNVNADALMSNHYHLLGDLSECGRPADVAQAFGELQSGYAKHFNRRTERRGPLFRPRFLSFAVADRNFFRVARVHPSEPGGSHRPPCARCVPVVEPARLPGTTRELSLARNRAAGIDDRRTTTHHGSDGLSDRGPVATRRPRTTSSLRPRRDRGVCPLDGRCGSGPRLEANR